MDKISNAIKCASCCAMLNSPVILPCGHSICKSHVEKNPKNQIKCGKCGKEHTIPNDGFLDNISLMEILSSQVHKINLGKVHEKAKLDTKDLQSLVFEVDYFLRDPTHQTYEKIADFKNQIFLRREEFKFIIDQETEILIKKFDEYELKFKNSISGSENKNRTKDLVAANNSVKQALENFKNRLEEINVNNEIWQCLCDEIGLEQKKLTNNLKDFKKSLISTDFENLKRSFSQNIDTDINYLKK